MRALRLRLQLGKIALRPIDGHGLRNLEMRGVVARLSSHSGEMLLAALSPKIHRVPHLAQKIGAAKSIMYLDCRVYFKIMPLGLGQARLPFPAFVQGFRMPAV